MDILGSLRAATSSSSRICSRGLLAHCESGSLRRPLQYGRVQSLTIPPRCWFNSSTVTDYQPSPPSWYLRRINSKYGGKPVSEPALEESPSDPARPQAVRMDGAQDDQAPLSESAPPASSSSSPGDGSDGADPPRSPPPEPPSSPQTSISKQSVPEIYPQVLALPITRRPLFPGFYKAVVVHNPAVVAAIKEMMRCGQPYLGAFLLKDEHTDSDVISDISSVHPVSVFAQITSVFTAGGKEDDKEEGLTAVLYPHCRIKITELIKGGSAKVEPAESSEESLPMPPPETASPSPLQTSFLKNYTISIVNVENLTTQPYNKDDQYIRAFMSEIDVLESLPVEDRLRKALLVLKKELINVQLQSKLARDVDNKTAKRQHEYHLMEQLKDIGIKKALSMESDGKDKLIEKFKERAASLKMPEGVRKVFDEELNKLMHLEPSASEANVTWNYLEWLTQIPWGQHSREKYSIAHAQQVLDEDHYGLKDVKDRILEFLAVGKLRGTVEGKITCLVGPPGVGKTSIGKSIARVLNRQFFRFSVGGLTDVAEIKGHRRTYVGALPGKIIQALKRVGTENPLVLIDEVDKIGQGINGDPSSALFEMLDPEQNTAFLEHYMDVPIDLSLVLFVCTANVLDTIPAPLLDCMEVLEVSGYISEEKAVIADNYLGPQAKEASGLKDADVQLDSATIDVLIEYYCRESGVRNLKKHIGKIYRKAALKLVQDLGEDVFPEEVAAVEASKEESKTVEKQDAPPNDPAAPETTVPKTDNEEGAGEHKVTTVERKPLKVLDTVHVRITPENLKDYIGPPVYYKDRMYVKPPQPGVSTGLGYLGNGSGAVMSIEATTMPGKGGLQLTRKLGEVIWESAQIAMSWVKSHAYELSITTTLEEQFLVDRDIHLCMPEGSIGKEGPSAGTAIMTALVSLFTKTKVNPDIGMTGEISLVEQVLPVSGLKENILVVHRAGIKMIIAPEANQPDIEENVPTSVKTEIRFVYVEDVREVPHEVFRGELVAERWKDTLALEES
ncbi:ATP-dependent protease La [Wolfiporia cocos MD-104 SS10]|uniref:endopeptidase La n=1 Tax=Wolfiporia cocos (strain MD-104) TaxID=742152 RepID=A0A2H3K011_WOLCO|nr:ATP-dependent protease La [Wolfiporia cocos MD-104 SS10]